MTRRAMTQVLAVALLVCGGSALAQERGRTDGPEGSEYGKGGYGEPGGGNFSLGLNWGAAFGTTSGLGGSPSGPPLFVGVQGSFWADERFLIDLSGNYLLHDDRFLVLAGPRFRTALYPVSFNVGVQAGAMFLQGGMLRFALAPNIGADLVLSDHYLLGLAYALDIPVGGGGVDHRIFMTLGYRF